MSGIDEELIARATAAMGHAYAPYSKFSVGAALEADDGRVFVGCNVENASYPVGMCAERVALGHAVASGARQFRRVAVASSGARPASPCGMCRQALAEFGIDLEVVSVTVGGDSRRWTLAELLPADFRLDA
jgi:cytidine deaminase